MAPEPPTDGQPVQPSGCGRHQRSRSEPRHNQTMPRHTASGARVEIDLTHDSEGQPSKHDRDKSCDGTTNKRIKLSIDNNGASEDSDEMLNPQTTFGYTKGKCDLEENMKLGMHKDLGDECRPHVVITSELDPGLDDKMRLSALRKSVRVANKKNRENQQKLQELKAQFEQRSQAVVEQNNIEMQRVNRQLQTKREENEELLKPTTASLETLQQELITAKEDLMESQNIAASRETGLEDARQEAQAAQNKYQKANNLAEAYNTVNEEWPTKRDQQQIEHSTKIQELKSQEKRLQINFNKQTEELNERIGALLRELQESQGLRQRYNFKISDEELTEHWGDLKHKIRQFVDNYTRFLPNLRTPEPTQLWVAPPPNALRFLASPMLAPYALEAYIWEALCLAIFDSGTMVWAGDLGRLFDNLSSTAEDRLRGPDDDLKSEYHSWRATSSNLLCRLSDRTYNHEVYHEYINAWVVDVQELLGNKVETTPAYRELLDILTDSRDFEIMRRKLKADVRVVFGGCDHKGVVARNNIPVDDSLMHRCSPAVKDAVDICVPTVEMIVCPGVMRWGNSSGTDYDRKTCLVKMDVLYSQPKDTAQPMPALFHQPGGGDTTLTNAHGSSAEPNMPSDVQNSCQNALLAQDMQSLPADTGYTSTRPHRAAKIGVRAACAKAVQPHEDEDEDELIGCK